ncbi:TIGR02391 family protein [Paenibacillus prosopidis]|uniref:TIGR02391 family protein n=1 Tax=Paenibacillus prosopidis TaxID=630520 RepID=UPI003CCC66A0
MCVKPDNERKTIIGLFYQRDKSITNQEKDGADLMQQAFTKNNPQIKLSDLSNESERNIQDGYMRAILVSLREIELVSSSISELWCVRACSRVSIDRERSQPVTVCNASYTCCTFIRFVAPACPIGTPADRITVSPG